MSRFRWLVFPLILAAAAPQTGCIGSFALTDKVFQWNRSLGSIVVQEIVFFAMLVVPVYEFTTFADAIVLNLIEFITGSNPLGAVDRAPREIAIAEGVTLSLADREGSISATLTGVTDQPLVRVYTLTPTGAVVRDASGSTLLSAELDAAGGIALTSPDGHTIVEYSPVEVQTASRAWTTSGPRALAAFARGAPESAVAAE